MCEQVCDQTPPPVMNSYLLQGRNRKSVSARSHAQFSAPTTSLPFLCKFRVVNFAHGPPAQLTLPLCNVIFQVLLQNCPGNDLIIIALPSYSPERVMDILRLDRRWRDLGLCNRLWLFGALMPSLCSWLLTGDLIHLITVFRALTTKHLGEEPGRRWSPSPCPSRGLCLALLPSFPALTVDGLICKVNRAYYIGLLGLLEARIKDLADFSVLQAGSQD